MRTGIYEIMTENGWLVHVELWNDDGSEIRATWSEIQAKLREVSVFLCDDEEMDFLEVYPRTSNEVNEVNKRHFFSFPDGLNDFMKAR